MWQQSSYTTPEGDDKASDWVRPSLSAAWALTLIRRLPQPRAGALEALPARKSELLTPGHPARRPGELSAQGKQDRREVTPP